MADPFTPSDALVEPVKPCECGCGKPAPIATRNRPNKGYVKGKPMRFVAGHQFRKYHWTGPEYVVDEDTGCWVWQHLRHEKGYGMMAGGRAHRVYYERAKGPIPDGLQLDHLCRNPSCVNPDHLEPVTNAVNQQRGSHTRLTPALVQEIRTSSESLREVAERLGVDKATVSLVRRRKTWKNIPGRLSDGGSDG